MKAKVTLLVDKDTVEKAKSIGINLSQFLEHNLKRAIKTSEEPENTSSSAQSSKIESSDNNSWRGGWDFRPILHGHSNPRDLSVTDLAGLRPTRLGDPRASVVCVSSRRLGSLILRF